MSRLRAIRDSLIILLVLSGAQFCGAAWSPAAAQSPSPAIRFKAYGGEGLSARMSDFSGLPVPRYSSLKYDEVNGRAGPSADYPVEWTYRRQGLPVVIVRESQEWRKIRDPEGDEVWVKSRMLSSTRTVVATSDGAVHRDPNARAAAVAKFNSGAVMTLANCRIEWCQVDAAGRRGWVPRSMLWGIADLPKPSNAD